MGSESDANDIGVSSRPGPTRLEAGNQMVAAIESRDRPRGRQGTSRAETAVAVAVGCHRQRRPSLVDGMRMHGRSGTRTGTGVLGDDVSRARGDPAGPTYTARGVMAWLRGKTYVAGLGGPENRTGGELERLSASFAR